MPRPARLHRRICRKHSCAAALLAATLSAHAGDDTIQAGVIRIHPLPSSTPLRTDITPSAAGALLGLRSFDAAGTSFHPGDATTLELTWVHGFTEHLSLVIAGGLPPKFKLYGKGTVSAPGVGGALFHIDVGAQENQPVATARQWSPAVLVQYHFLDGSYRIRPSLGAGLSYTFFTKAQLGPAIDRDLNSQFGAPLALAALRPGPTHARAHAPPSWVPLINAGLSYSFAEHWELLGSLTFAFHSTTPRIDLLAADGTLLARSSTRLSIDPLVFGLLVAYRF